MDEMMLLRDCQTSLLHLMINQGLKCLRITSQGRRECSSEGIGRNAAAVITV